MKTNVAETSIEAIKQHREGGGSLAQREVIMNCLQHQPKITRGEIAALTKIDKSAVAGRVYSLIAENMVIELGKRKCAQSGRLCQVLELVK